MVTHWLPKDLNGGEVKGKWDKMAEIEQKRDTRVVRLPSELVERAEKERAVLTKTEGILSTIAFMGLGAFIGWFLSQLFREPRADRKSQCPICGELIGWGSDSCYRCRAKLAWIPKPILT
jgi:hypothetical protein